MSYQKHVQCSSCVFAWMDVLFTQQKAESMCPLPAVQSCRNVRLLGDRGRVTIAQATKWDTDRAQCTPELCAVGFFFFNPHTHTDTQRHVHTQTQHTLHTYNAKLLLSCDLDLESSNIIFFTRRSGLMVYYQTFACQRISSLEDIAKESYFNHMSPCCDLDLEDSEQIFPHHTQTHDAMSSLMLCHHIKFGNKMYHGSMDIQTNIHWHFEPSLWPWPWKL